MKLLSLFKRKPEVKRPIREIVEDTELNVELIMELLRKMGQENQKKSEQQPLQEQSDLEPFEPFEPFDTGE
jgi:hypothetical protein